MSLTDKMTEALLPKIGKAANKVGVEAKIGTLKKIVKKMFAVPASSTIGIEFIRGSGQFMFEWKSAMTSIMKAVQRELGRGGGLLKIKPLMIEGADKNILVLTSDLNESLTEGAKVLDHLLQGLAKGFRYSEESWYEESGEKCPYTISLLTSDDDGKKVAITLQVTKQTNSFNACGKRLWEYAEEYLAEEGGVFNIKLHQVRTFGKYTLVLEMK